MSPPAPRPAPDWHIAIYRRAYDSASEKVIHYADKFGLQWYAEYRWALIEAQVENHVR